MKCGKTEYNLMLHKKKARRKEKHYVLCVVELFFFLARAKVELNEMNTKLQIEHKYMAYLVVALFFPYIIFIACCACFVVTFERW